MIRKDYLFGNQAREAIKKTATLIGDTLGKTLGPAGRNYQTPAGITNDGRSILSHIRFADECEDNVALAFHEIANKTDGEGGDGTTTATVIGTALTLDLIDKVPDLDTPVPGQKSVMELSRELEIEKDKAIEILKGKIIPVETIEQLYAVARTSMEDEDIAKTIADTVFKAGKDSYTALEEGFSGGIETTIQPGIEVPVRLNYGTDVTVQNVPVLVVNHTFEEYRELTPFMNSMITFMNENKMPQGAFEAIVIVAKRFSIPFIQRVAEVNMKSAIKIVCLSNDHLDDDLFEDVAAFTDAKYVDTHPRSGNKIIDVTFKNCGQADKVVATSKGAVFLGGNGTELQDGQNTTRVIARTILLQEQLAKETDPKNRTALERRISEFQGGKTTIYVDAKTAAEKYYLKLKVQDCMNSCKTALEGGMVRGGGLTLKETAIQLGTDSLLYRALVAPYERIQQNAGGHLEIGEDVMDSFLVAEAGVRNAVSVVKTVLTIEGLIADHPKNMVEDLGAVLTGE